MPLVSTLDVIWISDETITPPHPKMVVCIEPDLGLFYRFNSRDHWKPCVFVAREPDHGFLDHDSYIECGDPLELDDYIVSESLKRRGVIGSVSHELCPQILEHLNVAKYLRQSDKDAIRSAMGF